MASLNHDSTVSLASLNHDSNLSLASLDHDSTLSLASLNHDSAVDTAESGFVASVTLQSQIWNLTVRLVILFDLWLLYKGIVTGVQEYKDLK